MNQILKLLKGKVFRNAGWIVSCKIIQMIISFFISIITARYLGPSNFGIINYVDSFVLFLTPVCTLGLENVIVKELVHAPDKQGETMGTVVVMQLISSMVCTIGITAMVFCLNSGSKTYTIIAFLYSLSLVFKCFEVVQYWYQSKLMSKISSIAGILAYIIMSFYKIFLLATGKSVEWFAFSVAIDALVLSILLMLFYKHHKGPKFKISWERGKEMLQKSYHFILSGVMVSVYWHFGRIILNHMVDEASVGYYSTANKLCTIWAFILVAIIDSVRPVLFEKFGKSKAEFEKLLKCLYTVIIYVSFSVALVLTVFAKPVILIMYGEAYAQSASVLKVLAWCNAFSYIGMARSIWSISNGLERYEKIMAAIGVICNITLNVTLIPLFGVVGAGLATLITQIFINYIVMFFFKELRPNGKLITEAFNLRKFFSNVKSIR